MHLASREMTDWDMRQETERRLRRTQSGLQEDRLPLSESWQKPGRSGVCQHSRRNGLLTLWHFDPFRPKHRCQSNECWQNTLVFVAHSVQRKAQTC